MHSAIDRHISLKSCSSIAERKMEKSVGVSTHSCLTPYLRPPLHCITILYTKKYKAL